ncbi:Nucleoside-diphosphate-sugar epimerase [Ectothiorhodospira mobilis]|uniref:Nucleoside-diphosphate-sugar epimerase n=1 Tax=Ectothiorhodospira mobilis TaxID=195064 RepID=A0A1I4SIK7_ECTMO|nr:GDP-mannose 4,6-dehydratase [Ectothiorhodospira mobilis]SFM64272.1 Nucleoside-diphosphate-sugar epimerase [Ectothiorhodospira mobilis]
MSRIVLVTGADGFTGRHLVQALEEQGDGVVAVTGPGHGGEDGASCDLTDAAAVKALVQRSRPTHVIHLAGVSFVAHADPEAFYRVNVLGTAHLLEALAALDATPEKVLLASSANVYGRPAVECIAEDLCPAPVNHYGCSKLAMEHMARTYGDRLPLILTRPFNYTGPGQDERFLIPKIVAHYRGREPVIQLGNIQVSRDFSDVRDITRAYLALLESDARDVTCNLCSGRAIALERIIAFMDALAGYTIQVRVDPRLVRRDEIPVLMGDPTRMRRLTGITPRPIEETLADLYAAAAGA